MKKQEVLSALDRLGTHPKRCFSQNFLTDANIIHKVIELAEVTAADTVLEIGPGLGSLTQELLKTGAKVIAVEKDSLLAANLPPHPNLTVHTADILEFPLPESTKVVASLPYNISSPILKYLCPHPFQSLTLILQKEFVDKMRAQPHSKKYGILSIYVQYYTSFHSAFPISASCFYPKPSVESAAIRIDSKHVPFFDFSLLEEAFHHRRKMITSTLHCTPNILEEIGASPKARPEELTVEQWISLVQKIGSTSLS